LDSSAILETIRGAIREKHLIEFNLHGLPRVAEPHVLGEHREQWQVLVYQVRGESRSARLPHWRRILIDEIVDLQVLTETFAGSRTDRYVDWDRIDVHVAPADLGP